MTAEQEAAWQRQLVSDILAEIDRDFEDICPHCGRKIAGGGSLSYMPTNRMPCAPRHSLGFRMADRDTCGQPMADSDAIGFMRTRTLEKLRHRPPLMERVCAGQWRFYRELSDGREVFRCRGCDDILVLTPRWSAAGLKWMRALQMVEADPQEYQWRADSIETIAEFMGDHVSMYSGPRSREPAAWTFER